MAARIEAPPEDQTDQSMRQVHHMFYTWYLSNQMDFWAPPLKAIADFPLYLFKTGSYSRAPLKAIDQPLLTIWEFAH